MRSEDWRPIESGPKDGTLVLLYRTGTLDAVSTGWFSSVFDRWTTHGATHWQPYEPPAPEGPQNAK